MKPLITGLLLLAFTAGHSQSHFTVHFDFNKYSLNSSAISRLDSFLLENKKSLSISEIELNGHCDAIGSDSYNDKLSIQRVATVKDYLYKHGIPAISFSQETGHGKKESLNENSTAEERQLNRRVDISFVPGKLKNNPDETSLKEKLTDSTITAGSTIVLKNINFVSGMHLFLQESEPMLQELLAAMRAFPKLVIRIEGHICCEETTGDGLDIETGLKNLSEARAKAVQDYLLKNGIEKQRISYKGFGHAAPIHPFPEKTEEEETQNRRVEIKIISR